MYSESEYRVLSGIYSTPFFSVPAMKTLNAIALFFLLLPSTYAFGLTNGSECAVLSALLPGKVSYQGNTTYTPSIRSYFSLQEQSLSPACIVSPTSNIDVSTLVATMAKFRRKSAKLGRFAIRSGGHTPFAGAANIDNGVTVDLSRLNSVTLSSDGGVAHVGAGTRWIQVYQKLDPLNLTVVGGRVAGIGVGGFLTGGGLSYLGPIHGWGCDNVVGFEIVLASGQITYVNSTSDLFLRLKGGSNNFGVVTRFDLKVYSQGPFWGGYIAYPITEVPRQLLAFSTFMSPENFDPNAAITQAYGYSNPGGQRSTSVILQYLEPSANPPVFQPFLNPSAEIINSMRISNTSDFVIEEDSVQAVNQRGLYVTITFRHHPALYRDVWNLFNASTASIRCVTGIQYYLIFQPTPELSVNNSLGFNPADERLVVCLLSVAYSNESDDVIVTETAKSLFANVATAAATRGVAHPYIYLNYAAPWQDPIGSYGARNKAALQAASKKYDPEGLFQEGVPGGFKLFP